MTTGERIKQARKSAGLTQTELADKIGVKYSAIHKYESGIVVNLKRETIDAIAKALNVKPSWLLCIDEEKKPTESFSAGLSDQEIDLINKFRTLTQMSKENVSQTVSLLSTLPSDKQEAVSSLVLTIRNTI